MAENTLKLDGQDGVQVALGGDIIHWSTAEQGGAGEIFGILVAAIVLFLTLGVVAMGLPLLNALFAMVVSLALTAVVGTRVLDVVDWTPQLAAMIGIGVGIDYALLILNRFRLERGARTDVRDATLIALDTSGRAVLFAGIVVVIAMLGMMPARHLVPLRAGDRRRARRSLATMLAALTLMPAILGTRIGRRIKKAKHTSADQETRLRLALERLRRPPPAAGRDRRPRRADRARRCPRCTCASRRATPAPTRRTTPRGSPTTCSSRASAPASTRRCCSRSSCRRPGDTAALPKISDALSKQDGIAAVLPPQLNEAGDTATMIAYPTTTPQDERTDADRRDGADRDAAAGRGRDRRAHLDRRHHRQQPRLLPDHPRQAAAVHRRRRRPLAAAARGRLPLAADPGQGRHLQPALDRRRVRRRDPDLPGRPRREPVRRRDRPDRVVPADHGLRRRLRPLDGLRGLPRLPHARGVDAHQGRQVRRPARPGHDRPRRHGGGDHHDRGLRRLRDRQRAGAGDDGRRLRRRRSSSTRSSSDCCCCPP